MECGAHGRRVGESEKLPRISAKTTPPHTFYGGWRGIARLHARNHGEVPCIERPQFPHSLPCGTRLSTEIDL